MIDVVLKKIEGFIPKHTTRDQAKDTGMAMTLICILIGYLGHKQYCIVCAIVLLLVTMTVPTMFRPAAKLWFGLSQMLGAVMSKILLSILFFSYSNTCWHDTKNAGQGFFTAEKVEKRQRFCI